LRSFGIGCSAIVAGSVKRNFKKDNTTVSIGLGVKGALGVVSTGAKAGFTVTAYDRGEIDDVGTKADISISMGLGAGSVGVASTASVSLMSPLKTNVGLTGGQKFK